MLTVLASLSAPGLELAGIRAEVVILIVSPCFRLVPILVGIADVEAAAAAVSALTEESSPRVSLVRVGETSTTECERVCLGIDEGSIGSRDRVSFLWTDGLRMVVVLDLPRRAVTAVVVEVD